MAYTVMAYIVMAWSTSTSLVCQTSSVATYLSTITLTMLVGTGLDLLSFDAPIASHARYNLPPTGGPLITLHGLNFDRVDVAPTATTSLASCLTLSWHTATTLRCVADAMAYASWEVQLTIGRQVGAALL